MLMQFWTPIMTMIGRCSQTWLPTSTKDGKPLQTIHSSILQIKSVSHFMSREEILPPRLKVQSARSSSQSDYPLQVEFQMHVLDHHVSTPIDRSDNPPFRHRFSLSQTIGVPLTTAFASAVEPIASAQDNSEDEYNKNLLSESMQLRQMMEANDFKDNAEREHEKVRKQLCDLRINKFVYTIQLTVAFIGQEQ